jgi:hypothetical protein
VTPPATTPPATTPALVPGAAEWIFNGYCGTTQSGACDAARPDCAAAGPIPGEACATALDRCLGPASAEGLRKKFVCAPRARSVWAVNALCNGAPGSTCETAKTPCAIDAPAAKDCAVTGEKCATTGKVFVCLPPAGNTWVLNALCGDAFAGERACSTYQDPLCPPTPGGTPCTTAGDRCKTDGTNGKVFACVAR